MSDPLETELHDLVASAGSRVDLCARLLAAHGVRSMAEIGVYRGAFAEQVLDDCPAIERYYLLDPWRHLDHWDKPANQSDDVFEQFYAEAMRRTEAHAEQRVVLRGTTTEVIDQIPDGSLDAVYVDGDHTLRGITIDLALVYPKVRPGGLLIGDDFCRTIFQHRGFEPTLVFPYAVYFAEAMGAPVFALPHRQFVLHKVGPGAHRFVDLAGGYGRTTLRQQIRRHDRQRDRRLAQRRAATAARGPRRLLAAARQALPGRRAG